MVIQLGERIELENFHELEPGELTILKKMIGNHANKFQNFRKLSLHLKDVHKTEKRQKFQIEAKLEVNGKHYGSQSTNFNLFFGINEVLESLRSQIHKD